MASLETTRGLDARTISRIRKNPQQALDIINNLNVPSRIDYRAQEDNVQQTAPQARQLNVPTDMYSTAPATRKRRNTNGGYTIQKGDTLSAIARRYGTTVQALAEANGIEDVNRIYVGDNLTIPGAATSKSNTVSRSIVKPTQTTPKSTRSASTGSNTRTTQNTQSDNRIYRSKRDLPEITITDNRINTQPVIFRRQTNTVNSTAQRAALIPNLNARVATPEEKRQAALVPTLKRRRLANAKPKSKGIV